MLAAVTLRHLVHPRHTAAFHHGCKKCGLHFSTLEHLDMHTSMSTCNGDMVWPTTVTPGCRCLTKAEAAEQDAAEAAAAALPPAPPKPAATKEAKKPVVAAVEADTVKRYCLPVHRIVNQW